MGDKKEKKGDKSTTQLLKDSRSKLYGDDNTEIPVPVVLNNFLTLFNRMDTRLSSIEKNTGKNTTTLSEMNAKMNSLTARVIDAEKDITAVKSRVTQLEATSQGTGNLFDEVKSKTDTLMTEIGKMHKERKEFLERQDTMKEELDTLQTENGKLNERLIDMQCRSMKYNLIFSGIPESEYEDSEDKLRQFLYYELGI